MGNLPATSLLFEDRYGTAKHEVQFQFPATAAIFCWGQNARAPIYA